MSCYACGALRPVNAVGRGHRAICLNAFIPNRDKKPAAADGAIRYGIPLAAVAVGVGSGGPRFTIIG